ncbi:carbohydrate kinase family protein [Mangrovicella endophytica]|uniref:carbohydrate kinase family protein n=1 Tax=Mangrovicella endophytica TaxID=2066697 RepID=UPI000C9E8FE9|nr:PfkB family carbohydrate kinase [Mangrovicella endophytica]
MRRLAVIGNVNVDLIMGPAEPWPAPGTEIVVEHDELRIGGAAGNTALAWAALGVPHEIFATVGSDAFGRWLIEGFGDRSRRWIVEDAATTVSVGITHPSGERTFFTSRGHLPDFSFASAKRMLEAVDLSGGILLICGSFLTGHLTEDYPRLFDWADAKGVDVALDTGWPLMGWTDAVRAQALSWLPRCRFLLLNEIEAASLSGISDRDEAGVALRARMAEGGIVVTKLGPDGARALGAGGEVHQAPAPAVEVVDTIGAGDVFNAGFLLAIAERRGLTEALVLGTRLASRAVSTLPRVYDLGDDR